MLSSFQKDLRALRDPLKAAFFPRFFKTGKGEYGEGDRFLGVTVPQTRAVVKKYRDLQLKDIEALLRDPIHEFRLAGVLLLVDRCTKGDERILREIFDFYCDHLTCVNNWDLVDSSAPGIVGAYLLLRKDRSLLDRFAKSSHLWTQRVAIVATYAFIRKGQFDDTIRIAEQLLHHKHDLIHKAVGWMLREVGKKDRKVLEKFLDTHAKEMPRTMLRYAVEKFGDGERKRYMER